MDKCKYKFDHCGDMACGYIGVFPQETNKQANERHMSICQGCEHEAVQVLQEEDRESSEEV